MNIVQALILFGLDYKELEKLNAFKLKSVYKKRLNQGGDIDEINKAYSSIKGEISKRVKEKIKEDKIIPDFPKLKTGRTIRSGSGQYSIQNIIELKKDILCPKRAMLAKTEGKEFPVSLPKGLDGNALMLAEFEGEYVKISVSPLEIGIHNSRTYKEFNSKDINEQNHEETIKADAGKVKAVKHEDEVKPDVSQENSDTSINNDEKEKELSGEQISISDDKLDFSSNEKTDEKPTAEGNRNVYENVAKWQNKKSFRLTKKVIHLNRKKKETVIALILTDISSKMSYILTTSQDIDLLQKISIEMDNTNSLDVNKLFRKYKNYEKLLISTPYFEDIKPNIPEYQTIELDINDDLEPEVIKDMFIEDILEELEVEGLNLKILIYDK